MITLNRKLFQNCYCGSPSENFITALLVDGGLKEARDVDNNIIISDSTLRSLLPPQFSKFQQDTRSCVFVNVVYLPKVYIRYYYHGVIGILKNSKIKAKMLKI